MTSTEYKMTGFDAWSIYTAIKLHFSEGTYDAFKFNFKGPRLQLNSFLARRDRYFFEKTAKKYNKKKQLIEFFLSNIIIGNSWVGNMTDEAYELWQGKMQSLQYSFKSQIVELNEYCVQHNISFDELFVAKNDLPLIIKLYTAQKLSLETMSILNILCNYTARINKTVSDPMGLIKHASHIVNRYQQFIASNIDRQKFKKIVINVFTSS
jgi:hypothetical protein